MKGAKSKAETKRADSSLSVKKSAGKKPAKTEKDPNKPKRPLSAYFVFLEEFREQYKAKHPNNKSVSEVGKASGAKWRMMSDDEKSPYVTKAEKRKKEYEKSMEAYNKKQEQGTNAAEENESDKAGSEVDDEEEGSGEEEDDD